MSYKILMLENHSEWNNLISKLPLNQQDIYYTPQYYKIYELNGEGKAACFVYEDGYGLAVYPFLINEINPLGFTLGKQYFDIQGAYGYNGVISSTYDKVFIESFYKAFEEFTQDSNIIVEFTRFYPLIGNEKFSNHHMTVLHDRVTVVIDLRESYMEIWKNAYSSKNRNKIRKAQKLGNSIEIIINPSDPDIDSFINIYEYSMRIVHADSYYFFNRNYFLNLFNLLRENISLINVLNSENVIVCSSIFFHFGEFFHYHLSGRTEKADNSVNNFLIDKAFDFAQKKGAKFFHLGGGRSTSFNDSLLKFKSNFSNKLLPFYIGKKIHNQAVYDDIVSQWELKYPEKLDKYKNYLLKYRY